VNLPDPGPNPFVPIDVDALPGAEEDGTEPPNDQQEQGAEDQGAQAPVPNQQAPVPNQGAQIEAQAEDQGAQVQVAAEAEDQQNVVVNENDDNIEGDDFPEDGNDNDVPDAEEDDETAEIAASNPEDKERRGKHFNTNEGEDYGRGKRAKRVTTRGSFSAFQTTANRNSKGKRKGKRKEKRKDNSFQRKKRTLRTNKKTRAKEVRTQKERDVAGE